MQMITSKSFFLNLFFSVYSNGNIPNVDQEDLEAIIDSISYGKT